MILQKLSAATLLCALLFAAHQSYADDWSYTLRPGDQLWTIAKKYCGSATVTEKIAEYNKLTNPAAIRAGQRIRIPTAWLAFSPSAATMTELAGAVSYLPDTALNTQPQAARRGQTISMGASVVTAAGSALVEFADGSRLAIQPQTRVLFNKLTAFGPAGMVDTHLRFAYGNGSADVQPQNRGDRFRIETPEGVAAVRGTEFRVGYGRDQKLATTETLEGEVAFLANAQVTPVPAGFGVAASADGVVKESLLEAPELKVATEYAQGSVLSWQPLQNAVAYQISWSTPALPNVTLKRETLTESAAGIDLDSGAYLARVRGVSASGIAGMDALANINILSTAPLLQDTAATLSGPVQLSWSTPGQESAYTLEITNQLSQQRTAYPTSNTTATIDLKPAPYAWRVSSDQSAWSDSATFTVLPMAPDNLAHTLKGKTVTVSWDAVADVDGYVLTIQRKDGHSVEVVTEDNKAIVELEDYGLHTLEVASQYQALHSRTSSTELMVARKPWWLLILPLLALAL